MSQRIGAVFVYANPRAELLREVESGRAPDTGLLGANHLAEHGIDAAVHDPLLSRLRLRGAAHRLAWSLREATIPFELGSGSVVCTPLAHLLPRTLRLRGRVAIVFNYGLNLILRRASPPRRRLLAGSLRAAAGVVCFGEAQRRELLELTGLPDRQVETVLFGVDERFFAFTPAPLDGYVLAVGRDLARDYATLAAAARGLDARVVVVADPRNLAGISFPDNVETRSSLSWADFRATYEAASCVVVPMRRDGFRYGSEASGLTAYLEAAAVGRAVVASDRSVLADYLEPGRTGVCVPAEDPAALREGIERVLGDETLARRLGAAARQAVEERLTTRRLAARLAPLVRAAAW